MIKCIKARVPFIQKGGIVCCLEKHLMAIAYELSGKQQLFSITEIPLVSQQFCDGIQQLVFGRSSLEPAN